MHLIIYRITVLPAPPASLPDLLHSSWSCERCYSNRECMLNAAVENKESTCSYNSKRTHTALFQHFTGHLDDTEIQYLKDWDRLIDLEASVMNKEITKSWLIPSLERERSTGKTISSLILDESSLDKNLDASCMGSSEFIVKFSRSPNAITACLLNTLKFEVGSRVVLSTDGSSVRSIGDTSSTQRHVFGISRATCKAIDEHNVHIRVSHADFRRISSLARSSCYHPLFRLDKDDFMAGTSTLRQNLVKLLTSDVAPFSTKAEASQETLSNTQQRLKSRASSLRRSIIHLDVPQFEPLSLNEIFGSNHMIALANEFSELNEDQKAATYKVTTIRIIRLFSR